MTFPRLPRQRRWPLRLVRITDPIPALELVRPDGRGWLICPLPGRKLENER
ncbi:hypothetical protein [Kitasatospora phosalacinea]|uniref:Uncharacterized protein n=1 Tax=Kitasatospora phosalacinea TaxID=2065 RepID=A0ABW6GRF2_9ACTN